MRSSDHRLDTLRVNWPRSDIHGSGRVGFGCFGTIPKCDRQTDRQDYSSSMSLYVA